MTSPESAHFPRLTRRRALQLGGTLLLAAPALLAACGGSPAATSVPNSGAAGSAPPQGNTKTYKIQFANDWNTGIRNEAVKKAIADFQALQPNVTIEALQMGSGAGTSNQGGLVEVVVTQFVAGQAPDLIFGWPEIVPIWNTYLTDLTPLWRDKKGDDLGIIDHPQITHLDGKRMAIDFAPSVGGWAINVSMFEQAGIPLPAEDWTWNDQLEIARKLTTGDGKQWGIWFPKSWDISFWPYVMSNMANQKSFYADEAETKVGYNSPEALEGFQWYIDLIHKHKVAPTPAAAAAAATAATNDMFMLGQAGMCELFFQSSGTVHRFVQDRFKWKMMPQPRAPKNTARWHHGQSEPLVVSKTAEKNGTVEAAFDFALFLPGNEAFQRYVAEPANRPTFPVKRSVLNSPAILQGPPENMQLAVQQLEDAANAINMRHPKKYWAEWMQTVLTEADRAIIGEAPAAQAWQNVVDKTQRVMDDNK